VILLYIVEVVHHLVFGRGEERSFEELYRECDFRARLLLEKRLVAGLNGLLTIIIVHWNISAENVGERPRLVLRGAFDTSLIDERYSVHQTTGLFLGRIPVRADLTRTARTTCALNGAPDGIALVAGDERNVDSLVELGFGRGHNGNVRLNADLGSLHDCLAGARPWFKCFILGQLSLSPPTVSIFI